MSLEKRTEIPLETWLERWPGWNVAESPPGKASSQLQPWDNSKLGYWPVPKPFPAHVGLWLDRCLLEPDSKKSEDPQSGKVGKDALHRAAIQALEAPSMPALEMYRPCFDRWRRRADERAPTTVRRVLELQAVSRILLHPSSLSTVTEGSLLLHHTYGVPYLPGTALKGICRTRARRLEQLQPYRFRKIFHSETEGSWFTELFGYVETDIDGGLGGLVDFWDALWVPHSEPGQRMRSPLARDIVNPHHSTYYSNPDHPAPTPTEEPIPSHFLSVRPGTRFLLVLEARANPGITSWLEFMLEELLLPALTFDGIGARTSSGYGRLEAVNQFPMSGSSGKTLAMQGGAQRVEAALEPGMVTRQKNDGTLKAVLANNEVAELRGPKARDVFQNLSEGVRHKIDKGKPQRLMVKWVKIGNQRVIDDVQEP